MYSFLIPMSKHFLSRQRLQNLRLEMSILQRSSYGHLKYSWNEGGVAVRRRKVGEWGGKREVGRGEGEYDDGGVEVKWRQD